jgi:glycosyltransferase involved in cell wall biosynthesis
MKIAFLHYSVSPVVGGVESVIKAHTSFFLDHGDSVRLIAGAGEQAALPKGAEFVSISEMDSRHPQVVEMSQQLEQGEVPPGFEAFSTHLADSLALALRSIDRVIIHNVFTKHFNLPLTAALFNLVDQGIVRHPTAWCHDFSWTSPHSRPSVHPGYPWDLLRTYREDVQYVTVSKYRQDELSRLLGCPPERVHVIYNGVDPVDLYSLTQQGKDLVDRLALINSDINLLMPVRITQAKNIEFAFHVIANLKKSGIRPKLVITGPPDPHDPTDMEYYQSLLNLREQLHVEREARFVYESGPEAHEGYTIDLTLVSEIYRVCDLLFMPSHREGFGMPILEAGLIGMPVFTTPIPAASEIGQHEVTIFSQDETAENVAQMILAWALTSPPQLLKRRVRQDLTWQAIFQHKILPLISEGGNP